jgi:hypothetical protein
VKLNGDDRSGMQLDIINSLCSSTLEPASNVVESCDAFHVVDAEAEDDSEYNLYCDNACAIKEDAAIVS